MKYGMPSLVEFNSIDENITFAKENNLDFIELNMDLPYCSNMQEKELLNKSIEFTMHVSEEINIGELNEYLLDSYLNEAIRQIKLGISNNIKKYTIHFSSGVYFTLPTGKFFLNEKFKEIYIRNITKSFTKLNDLALKNNIEINFENTKIENFTKEAINLINNYQGLGFTLDIGHNEKNGNKAYPLFKEINKIRHIHMHDYDGKTDHLSIGNGQIDFKKYQEELNKCYVVIEIKTSDELQTSLNKLK